MHAGRPGILSCRPMIEAVALVGQGGAVLWAYCFSAAAAAVAAPAAAEGAAPAGLPPLGLLQETMSAVLVSATGGGGGGGGGGAAGGKFGDSAARGGGGRTRLGRSARAHWAILNDLNLILFAFIDAAAAAAQLPYLPPLLRAFAGEIRRLVPPAAAGAAGAAHSRATAGELALLAFFRAEKAAVDALFLQLLERAESEAERGAPAPRAVAAATTAAAPANTPTAATGGWKAYCGTGKVTKNRLKVLDYSGAVDGADGAGGVGAAGAAGAVGAAGTGEGKALSGVVRDGDAGAAECAGSARGGKNRVEAAGAADSTTGSTGGAGGEGGGFSDSSDGDEEAAGGVLQRWAARLRNLAGNRVLGAADLEGVAAEVKAGLVGKNVAPEVADAVVSAVERALVGRKTASFETAAAALRAALKDALSVILTQNKPVDVLKAALDAKQQRRVYSICFLGVNGVGKSTSLAKVAYYLKHRGGLKVGIAACDTFRAGAVEQLRTHARNLGVDLFERGYGKDPAQIAREALRHFAGWGTDVCLIDTAGRMQDNEPLMRALAQLVAVNRPDLVLFVGEALVGNDAVDQLVKFNRALVESAPREAASPRGIDGVFLTKFDTVDDRVGAALSMAHTAQQPVIFVGTGQKYTQLQPFRVGAVLKALLQ